MTLQAKLDAFRHQFETTMAPPEAVAIIHRTTDELIATGQADRALKAGDRAPDFSLPDADGRMVRATDLLASGPIALTFYRGVWCPYCNLDLQALEEAANAIRATGAQLIAITPQQAASSRKAIRDNSLTFPVLSDAGNQVADAFGLRFRLQDELSALYASFGVDLPGSNGDDSQTLPMPARYVIGTDGKIAYAEVNPDYTRRPEPGEMIAVLESLRVTA
ncbi:MAG: alkyl hydroperoxide reductase [Sphingomonas sp.]|nr:alkyl hydroperoxide reductase [Sphingomonas sp.]